MTVERWAYEGVVLNVGDRGQVTLVELEEFTRTVKLLDAQIHVYEFGLRATRLTGDGGPRLDWRD